MKIYSWNVNGLRACLKKGFVDVVATADADIFCLQEVRATPEQLSLEIPGYQIIWNPAERKGYSGTMVLSRVSFSQVDFGLGDFLEDLEGRVITAELRDFFVVNVYTPNSGRGLPRLDYRTTQWDQAFLQYVKQLERTKPVIFCGDLNVAHREIDLANPQSNRRNAGFTDEERGTFDKLLASGFIDTFRHFNQEGGHYTWWSNMANSRARNIGWRIDYFCVSEALQSCLVKADIHPAIMGSDHCPVALELRC